MNMSRGPAAFCALVLPALLLILGLGLTTEGQQNVQPDAGVARAISDLSRGDAYRAVLSLKDAVARLGPNLYARKDLASAHALLVWAYLSLDRPEEAQSSLDLALKADPFISVAAEAFPSNVVGLFERARRPPSASPEAAGRAALDGGRPHEAFLEFLSLVRPPAAPLAPSEDERVRRQIIESVSRMKGAPPIPQSARERFDKAMALEEAQRLLGAGTSSASAGAVQQELKAALRIAPWWPEALFKLAQSQQGAGQLDEAMTTLSLYKMADPGGVRRAAQTSEPDPSALAIEPSLASRPRESASEGEAGTIVVYWSPQFKGGGRPKIKCDGARVADLSKGSFIQIKAAPGLHNVTFYNDTAGVRVLAGGVSYLRAAAVGFPARAELREVPAETAEREIKEKGVEQNQAKKTYSDICGVGKS